MIEREQFRDQDSFKRCNRKKPQNVVKMKPTPKSTILKTKPKSKPKPKSKSRSKRVRGKGRKTKKNMFSKKNKQ